MARVRTLLDLEEGDLDGRRVLMRADFNVPLDDRGNVTDATRVKATLPTIRHLQERGAPTVLVSHLGRPKGAPDPALSLTPVNGLLETFLDAPVLFLRAAPGTAELDERVAALAHGAVALLENVRFLPGETDNDPKLARSLAGLADVFVGEAFGTAHRAHASTVGAPRAIREKGGRAVAGFLMDKELRYLDGILRSPERPFVALMGGAKISGKMDLIEAILGRVDRLLVGGAMANTFLRALGLETGRSLVEEDRVEVARQLLERGGDKLLLPVDCVAASEIAASASPREVDRTEVGPEDRIGDIGPRTREIFSREIRSARSVLWNGPMGVFEMGPFAEGTRHMALALAEAADGGAVVVVGGGDSAAATEQAGVASRMSHVSTGGGASLDLLSGKPLPGVDVLETEEAAE